MEIQARLWSESSLLRQQVVQAWWVLATSPPVPLTRDVLPVGGGDDDE